MFVTWILSENTPTRRVSTSGGEDSNMILANSPSHTCRPDPSE